MGDGTRCRSLLGLSSRHAVSVMRVDVEPGLEATSETVPHASHYPMLTSPDTGVCHDGCLGPAAPLFVGFSALVNEAWYTAVATTYVAITHTNSHSLVWYCKSSLAPSWSVGQGSI